MTTTIQLYKDCRWISMYWD